MVAAAVTLILADFLCARDALLLVTAEILSPSDSSELVFMANIAATAVFSVLISDFLSLFDVFELLLPVVLPSIISSAETFSVLSCDAVLSIPCFILSAFAAASAALPEFIEASEGDRETVRETSPGPDSTDAWHVPFVDSADGAVAVAGGGSGGPYADTGYGGEP